jgi:hypothetical protein
MKPEGMSQSAWDEAEAEASVYLVWLGPDATKHEPDAHHVLTYSIARAIDAATERAALIAENHNEWPQEGADIAAAIRQGSQPSNAIPVRGTVR